MKNNYIKSAELKIGKNPDMSEQDKKLLMLEAKQKELKLKIKLGLVRKVYTPTDSYARDRGLRAQNFVIDEWLYNAFMTTPVQTYTPTATQLTRDNLDALIESVRATHVQPITYDREYIGTWEPMRHDAVVRWGE